MFNRHRYLAEGGMVPPPTEQQAQGQPDQGVDVEGQIKQGVEAFMQSQDPAIAVEVVNMLAEMMGIAPQVSAYGQPGQQAPDQAQIPMGGHGMKMFRKGGKVYAKVDPDPKDKKKSATTPSMLNLLKVDPKDSPEQRKMKEKANEVAATIFNNNRTGSHGIKNHKPYGAPENQQQGPEISVFRIDEESAKKADSIRANMKIKYAKKK